MKVTFYCDNGANIHSCISETWDLSKSNDVSSFGMTAKEWKESDESTRQQMVTDWANNHLYIYFETEV